MTLSEVTPMQEYYGMFPETRKLQHHGVKGQSWGIRRFQNTDGSLTALGKQRREQETGSKTILRDVNTKNDNSVLTDSRRQVSPSASSFSMSFTARKLSDASSMSVSQVNSNAKSIDSGKTAVENAMSSPSNFSVNKFSITREMIQKALTEKRSAENKKAESSKKKAEAKTEETEKKTTETKKTTAKKTSTKKTSSSKSTSKKTTSKKKSSSKKTSSKKSSTETSKKNTTISRGPKTTTRDLEMASRSASRKAADNFLKRYQIKR